ncbi:OmpH family outer membrane protein [Brumimicrobium aurantiacum]|uniref:OmpH family outer membrane protein n=1 Tax=Brumimicrobium aurantiacum TaxID=1737063 RepID=A0A3E1EYA9_9FLAO|nr:OmpH family outer membrane protein [Brumimicrobium aurantiacum]RFC54529.1 OmpH family outer membrane protein [Brumimicrobium aurantiacum]
MRNLFLILTIVFGTSFASIGQKYGYIDSDYILESMPEYNQAQEELNTYATRWQNEIDERYKQIKKRKEEFLRVEAILPKEERLKREEEIEKMESEALEMQQQRFGVSGELFSKRKELIEPIQDRVFEALGKVASDRNFAFVFDKANQSNLIFADPKYDISKMVLREMGIQGK